MQNDPTTYIIAAAILGACIGFMGCGLFASRAIRRAQIISWREGHRAGRNHPEHSTPGPLFDTDH